MRLPLFAMLKMFILGSKVGSWSRRSRRLCKAGHAVGTSSGTDAQLLILMALGVGAGDAVVTTPFTFFLPPGCIARLGARPVFVDIDPETLNLSPGELERILRHTSALSKKEDSCTRDGLRIKAVIPVHLFGACCRDGRNSGGVRPLSVTHDRRRRPGDRCRIPFQQMDPSAQALSREYGYLSFYPTKNLGAFGDAGMTITSARMDGPSHESSSKSWDGKKIPP